MYEEKVVHKNNIFYLNIFYTTYTQAKRSSAFTKYRMLRTKTDCQELQGDLTGLHGWSIKWWLKFTMNKERLTHTGESLNFKYE